jgi:predicted acetyltransferase
MIVDLGEARLEDREILARMLDDYLHELAAHRERAVGASNSREYPYLDAYFSESGRHPFLIRQQGSVVGLALIRSPASTGAVWEIAEFYIVPENRRAGVGGVALACIWRRFPGDWELQVHIRNTDALRFWLFCVNKWASRAPEVAEVEAEDGRRLQLRFRVDNG